jgi:protein TonB
VADSQTFFEYQVEHPVTVAAAILHRYSPSLHQRIEGEVLAQFVADTFGMADMRTFKVLKSSHDLFTDAVRTSLPAMRFNPALVGGRKVKQLVQMPFQFNLSHDVTAGTPIRPGANNPAFVKAKTPPIETAKGTYFEFR